MGYRSNSSRQLLRKAIFESLETRRVLAANPLQGMFASEWADDAGEGHGHGPSCGCGGCAREIQVAGGLQGEGESGWSPGSPATIIERVTVQPIIVSNSDGTNTAEYMGTPTQRAGIQSLIDEVWAQAGIDVKWLEPNYWNSTQANLGNGSTTQTRSSFDLNWIVSNGDAQGYGNPDPLVLDMYFVEISPGFKDLGNNYVNGYAFVGGNGSTLHVGDNAPGSQGGREVAARVIAHEIGHNLGLSHVSIVDNLMEQGEQLNSSQISTAIASRYSVPLPANSPPEVVNPIADLSVNENAPNTTIDLGTVFNDADGDNLTYSVTVGTGAPLTATVSGDSLILSYLQNQVGTTTVTVTARDPLGASAQDQFTVTVADTIPNDATDWGTIDYTSSTAQAVNGTRWYQMKASQAGTLSVLAQYDGGAGNLEIELYDAALNKLAGNATVGLQRIDTTVAAGATYYLKAMGSATVDFHATNMLHLGGSTARVTGTPRADTLVLQPQGSQAILTIGVFAYSLTSTYNTFDITGGDGADSLQVQGSSAAEQVVMRAGSLSFSGSGITVNATAETVTVSSGGGADTVTFEDSPGNDSLNASPANAVMQGPGYSNTASGFSNVTANASQGVDEASLFDGEGNDSLTAEPTSVRLRGQAGSFVIQANGFDKTFAFALAGGNDTAALSDGATDDHFATYPEYAFLYSLTGEFFNYVRGFDNVTATASTGNDVTIFNDGPTNDTLEMGPNTGRFTSGDGSWDYTGNGFRRVYAYSAAGGSDTAVMRDSADDDVFYGTYEHSFLQNDNFVSYARGFETVSGYSAAGGEDRSFLYDSPGNDVLTASPTLVNLQAAAGGYSINAHDFGQVYVAASDGDDSASFLDSAGDDQFVAYPASAYMFAPGGGYLNSALGFDRYSGSASTGNDTAVLFDGQNDDTLEMTPTQSIMRGVGFTNTATAFDQVYGYSQAGGSDSVTFRDGAGDDMFTASPESSSMQASGYLNIASGFATVVAHAGSGGNDIASLFDSSGDDVATVRPEFARLASASFSYTVYDFPSVYATSSRGGTDTLDKEAVDYLFLEFGNWN